MNDIRSPEYYLSNFSHFITSKHHLMDRVSFNEAHSRAIRFWHWATVLVLSFILLTAFTGKFFFNNIRISNLLDQQMHKQGFSPTGEQVWDTTFVLRDMVWRWHTIFGYILAGLFFFRVLVEFFQPREEKYRVRIARAFGLRRTKQDGKTARHYLLVKLVYILAYGMIGTLAGTGIWMSFRRNTPEYFTERFHSIKGIHELTVNLFLLFMLIHLVGVIRAERGRYRNIVSGMIHGRGGRTDR
jgi:cytochrome b